MFDPASGRLITSWAKSSREVNRFASRAARHHAASEIPIAA
jgi:hypothetical protein